MKKEKLKLSRYDVDGPFAKAREKLIAFGRGMTFTSMVQLTVVEMQKCEEEYELACFMDDPELMKEKKRELDSLTRSLVYAANLLEEESGIDA